MKWAFLLAVSAAVFVTVAFTGLGALLLDSLSGEGGCEQRQVLAEADSPDGAWVARIYHNRCIGPFLMGFIGVTAEVTPSGEKPKASPGADAVFAMEDMFGDQPTPETLKWLDDRKLEITIPNDAWAGRRQETYADVAITYRYLNDDSIERDCLKQWQSRSKDDQVRRSMLPNDNMKAFLTRCHAEQMQH